MVLLRESLDEQIDKMNDGKITTMKQSNVLNLMKIYAANIAALAACRIEMQDILSEDEVSNIQRLQYGKLEELSLLEGQKDKPDEELTPEEIL